MSRARAGEVAVAITGIGMVTSIGYRAWPAAAAMVARVKRFMEADEAVDREGELIVAAPVTLFAQSDQSALEMALTAAGEAVEQAFGGVEESLEHLRSWVSMSSGTPSPGQPSAFGVAPWDRLELAVPELRPAPDSDLRTGHHAVGLLAVRDALARLRDGRADICLVGGVDSLLSAIAVLDAEDRLKTAYSPYGVTPGEASAFVLLERAVDAEKRGARPLSIIRALGTGEGPALTWPPRNDGARSLCEALDGATRGANSVRDRMTIVCDLNGEAHRASEWGLGRSRVLRFAREIDLYHPADAVGEVGAATGPLLLALATFLLNRLFSPSSDALVWTSGDDGPRAAVHLLAAQPPS